MELKDRILALANNDSSGYSCGELIAIAFVKDDMSLLPSSYPDQKDAWERLGETWQQGVMEARQEYHSKNRESGLNSK